MNTTLKKPPVTQVCAGKKPQITQITPMAPALDYKQQIKQINLINFTFYLKSAALRAKIKASLKFISKWKRCRAKIYFSF